MIKFLSAIVDFLHTEEQDGWTFVLKRVSAFSHIFVSNDHKILYNSGRGYFHFKLRIKWLFNMQAVIHGL